MAEVKSITDKDEVTQLRLGLGQLLHYRHVLQRLIEQVSAVLVLERAPTDDTWAQLCEVLGVELTYPPFAGLGAGWTTGPR